MTLASFPNPSHFKAEIVQIFLHFTSIHFSLIARELEIFCVFIDHLNFTFYCVQPVSIFSYKLILYETIPLSIQ